MNLQSLRDYIIQIKNQAKEHREKAEKLDVKVETLEEAYNLLDKKDKYSSLNKYNSLKEGSNSEKVGRQKTTCKGNTRIVYSLMRDENRPIRPAEIYSITKINKNTIHGIIRNGYEKRGILDKIEDGLYQINEKGLELLEITKDNDVKRDIQQEELAKLLD